MCALRTGQIVNYESLAHDVGVSPVTIKEWLGLLEDSFVIKLVHPYFSNRSKRLIKSPKIYFLDMGLAAYLAGWKDGEMLRLGPMAGAAFETQALGEILRFFRHRVKEVQIHFWKDRDARELDFLVDVGSTVFPIEVKMGYPRLADLPKLESVRESNWADGAVLSLAAGIKATRLTPQWYLVHPAQLGKVFE